MRSHRRSTAAALLLSAALVLGTAACTGGGDDGADAAPSTDASAGTTIDWPKAVDPAATTEPFVVVWTAVVENGDGATQQVQPEIEKLNEVGYQTLPWSPSCQSTAGEQLSALTGYADPLGVGVAFATAEDASKFDTLYEASNTISMTTGTYTCAAAS